MQEQDSSSLFVRVARLVALVTAGGAAYLLLSAAPAAAQTNFVSSESEISNNGVAVANSGRNDAEGNTTRAVQASSAEAAVGASDEVDVSATDADASDGTTSITTGNATATGNVAHTEVRQTAQVDSGASVAGPVPASRGTGPTAAATTVDSGPARAAAAAGSPSADGTGSTTVIDPPPAGAAPTGSATSLGAAGSTGITASGVPLAPLILSSDPSVANAGACPSRPRPTPGPGQQRAGGRLRSRSTPANHRQPDRFG